MNIDKELMDSIITLNYISEIPTTKRTNEQQSQFEKAQAYVIENYDKIFERLCSNDLGNIKFDLSDVKQFNMSRYYSILHDTNTKVPEVKQPVTKESLELANVRLYEAIVSVSSILEELAPVYDSWVSREKRMADLCKSMFVFEKEFKAQSMFQLLYPQETYNRVRELGEMVETARRRLTALNEAQKVVSRLVTIVLGEPGESLSVPENSRRVSGNKPVPSFMDRMQTK